MANESASTTPDPSARPLIVAGVRLEDVVAGSGPFGSLFVGPGGGLRSRSVVALDKVPVPAPHAGELLTLVEDENARSQVVVTDGSETWRFLLDDPLAIDLARFGDIPSLGPVVEAAQITVPHAVVTIEDDVFGVTSFGAIEVGVDPTEGRTQPPTEPAILEALDHLVDSLRSSEVQLAALMGSEDDVLELQGHLQDALPLVRVNVYPTDDIDRDLLSTADEVVRDAASQAAEQRTHELAHFRQARSAAQTVEGAAAIGAIKAGEAQRLLVHDDLADTSDGGVTRLADRAIVAAIRARVPITMIPKVSADRGPNEGLGVIMRGSGVGVPVADPEPRSVEHQQLRV